MNGNIEETDITAINSIDSSDIDEGRYSTRYTFEQINFNMVSIETDSKEYFLDRSMVQIDSVEVSDSTISIVYETLPEFMIYPNPVHSGDKLIANVEEIDYDSYTFYNQLGQQVVKEGIGNNSQALLTVPEISGTYYLGFFKDGRLVSQMKRIIIQ